MPILVQPTYIVDQRYQMDNERQLEVVWGSIIKVRAQEKTTVWTLMDQTGGGHCPLRCICG